ncbi:RNA polymerase sigma factor [Proteiniphilum sp. UBA1028]|jgi:RNA polymerase sigma-70 factor (ECF subfamily)|uniref:RNA polymerase sigma factor n=1 Tax=Proteiniphilum sp. UBA1028 TaxID=1947251 RepID=UPI000E93FC6F|nr:RNA polymerase sigma factor [Proteiniphilum sp. UBA1028]HBG56605.1 RNA polymerase subunit sigma [Porphyromonadaceae bacterium]
MTKEENSVRELIRQIVQGNRVAMKRFYDDHSGYLTAVCARYISNREDIKDVLQESFLKIFKAIQTFEYKGAGSLRAWSARIVVNEALKHIRAAGKMQFTSLPEWDLPNPEEDREPDFEDIPASAILEMIRTLPPGYRTVFNLYVLEQKSHKEIASILNIAESSSASQLHRAKGILVKEIELYRLKKKHYERSMAR